MSGTQGGKVTTNTDGRNRKHRVGEVRCKGISKDGAEKLVEGGEPESSKDRAAVRDAGVRDKINQIVGEGVENRMKSADKASRLVRGLL